MMKTKTNHSAMKGFTLIELIVAMGIFAFAATFAIASLLSLMAAQRKAAATQDAFDNIRYGIEFMAKETREAKSISNPCLLRPGYTNPKFVCDELTLYRGPAGEETVHYYWLQDGTSKQLWRRETVGGNDKVYPLTSSRITINHASFYISNPENSSDEFQPYVIFVVNATGGDPNKLGQQTTIHLQTAASLWRLDRP